MKWICLLTALALPSLAQAAAADSPVRASIHGHAERFEWEEFNDDGSRILKESGPLFGIGGNVDFDTRHGFHLEALGDFFAGRVDYDGATQMGEPVSSKTQYAGLMAEGNVAIPVNCGRGFTISPYGGAGGRVWQRDLEDSGNASGYEEYWSTYYGIAGLRVTVRVSPAIELYGKAAVKMPFYNRVDYDFTRIGGPDSVVVEPGKKAGPHAELGMTIGRFVLAGFYERMTFEKSDYAGVGSDIIVWQPKSEATILGVRAGMSF